MFENFRLEIELATETAIFPTRAHDSDAGIDVYADEDVIIHPGEDKLISTGIKTSFPKGYGLLFQNKSGVARKKKLILGACLVDPEYRGIVYVHLFNKGENRTQIKKGDKLSQFIVIPVWNGHPQQVVEVLKTTDRGEGGFGSTGDKHEVSK